LAKGKLGRLVREYERELIERALAAARGDQASRPGASGCGPRRSTRR